MGVSDAKWGKKRDECRKDRYRLNNNKRCNLGLHLRTQTYLQTSSAGLDNALSAAATMQLAAMQLVYQQRELRA
ncbi:hypothetical protein QLX08_003963 [Tetragonisca angustula]|uniref:Uncharacterized protein n=1 Tax=Tetragonisca angustula TaxID=166442 RepID=A0AAW1A4E3_9HYME